MLDPLRPSGHLREAHSKCPQFRDGYFFVPPQCWLSDLGDIGPEAKRSGGQAGVGGYPARGIRISPFNARNLRLSIN